MLCDRMSLIVGDLELGMQSSIFLLVLHFCQKPTFEHVVGLRFDVWKEFIGEETGTVDQTGEISFAEHANGSHPTPGAAFETLGEPNFIPRQVVVVLRRRPQQGSSGDGECVRVVVQCSEQRLIRNDHAHVIFVLSQ